LFYLQKKLIIIPRIRGGDLAIKPKLQKIGRYLKRAFSAVSKVIVMAMLKALDLVIKKLSLWRYELTYASHLKVRSVHDNLVIKSPIYKKTTESKYAIPVRNATLSAFFASLLIFLTIQYVLPQFNLFNPGKVFAGANSQTWSSQDDFKNNNGTTGFVTGVSSGDGTGGTITHSGGYTIHTFTSSAQSPFTPPVGVSSVEALVVAGGGGGGGAAGTTGGGGAGGLLYSASVAVSNQAYPITVGTGGTAGNVSDGGNGNNSVFSSMTAIGGGGGRAIRTGNGLSGGSGGGAAWNGPTQRSGGSGTAGQGNNGGAGGTADPPAKGGGGGGAGAVGDPGTSTGNGGVGLAYSISGTSTYYAGGGGGGSQVSGNFGAGGNGGGGAGSGDSNGTAGTPNTGGGGGGGGSVANRLGGAGGSGVVILRYIPVPSVVDLTTTPGSVRQVLPAYTAPLGNGSDGALTVSAADFNINTQTNGNSGRSAADGVIYSVVDNTASGQKNIIVNSATTTGLAVNDEIMIINQKGTTGDFASVGLYEFGTISSITNGTPSSKSTIVVTSNLTNTYNGTTQKINIQRIPNYTNVTVSNNYNITPSVWDGTKGGILAFRSNGTVNVASGSSINANGKGYRGGTGGAYTTQAQMGEYYAGGCLLPVVFKAQVVLPERVVVVVFMLLAQQLAIPMEPAALAGPISARAAAAALTWQGGSLVIFMIMVMGETEATDLLGEEGTAEAGLLLR